MASINMALQVNCYLQRPSFSDDFRHLQKRFSSNFKPLLRELQEVPVKIGVPENIKNTSIKLLDAFVDSTFQFVDQPLLPLQSNFAPVEELNKAIVITSVDIEGEIPYDFPEGAYIRNGPNPLFGGLKSTVSMFGRSSHTWIEGEGMLHVLYFNKNGESNKPWTVLYNNRYVETETFKLEKQRNNPCLLPAIEGHSPAILAAYLFNKLRFGKANKLISNTNVFEHSGKLYSIAENHIPQEIDVMTLRTLGNWDVMGAWNRAFTSHPKRAPGTGELVTIGVDATKPFVQLGIISADGKRLLHKVDLGFDRCTIIHEPCVTQRYNVIMDFPLTIDIDRLFRGGPLIKYSKEDCARIGLMPRYGNKDSIRWFEVDSGCSFHTFNSYEDGDEVVVRGCKALQSIIPGPEMGLNKFEWFSRGFKHIDSVDTEAGQPQDGLLFDRCYEWRLNMRTGDVKERYLTGTRFSMDFPIINGDFTGIKNKFGYSQIVDSEASSNAGMAKYGGLAKMYFEEPSIINSTERGNHKSEDVIKVEYHKFEKNIFCTGASFVPKMGGLEEDDGWIITFVHNEDTDLSKVYIIDAKKFTSEPVAKIALPGRVPYGFHGIFMPLSLPNLTK